ncbi:Rne/Rng family ribonuclease [Poriferisphaera sp. WC338]|uniref:Rne/Rng family ribonuclease n=1 Tax=Poriferisphaera sp. WC338 TaxID=3425129 RepID=UPI003D816072
MSKSEMLINYVPGEECRIAIVKDKRLDEFYQERASAESHVGNIYKGRVTNVEPSIQAAFIDFGLERNGFLHISDLHPKYFPGKDREEFEQVGSKTPRRERPPIQKCLKRGQEVLVQVLKEGIGTKGPTLTSYLSIPGRFIVMMPDMQRMGVSRKVGDDDSRREMRKILAELKPPEGFGFIIRTAGIGQTKTDIKRDLAYLARLWKSIETRKKATKTVGELYAESDLVIRTIRDVFSPDIERIVIDDLTAAKRARDFLAVANPRTKTKVIYYHDPVPLFNRFAIEQQIEQINAREVPLPSGGALVFDQTEALVAIDVNSGTSREAKDAESNAFNTNKEAVAEICRQLKLRDLGGLVVNDLIDMREMKHRRKIESLFRQYLKDDRARSRINPISQFGMLEMTRQRMRPSLKKSIYNECAHCAGLGHVKSPETVVLEVMRQLALVMHHEKVAHIELTISPDVAFQLLNRKRAQLVTLERKYGKPVMVRVGGSQIDTLEIKAIDERKVALNVEMLCKPAHVAKPTEKSYIDLAIDEIPETEEDQVVFETDDELESELTQLVAEQQERETQEAKEDKDDSDEEGGKKRRRRRRGSRGRRGRGSKDGESSEESKDQSSNKDKKKDSSEKNQSSRSEDPRNDNKRGDAKGRDDKRRRDDRKRRSGRDESRHDREEENKDGKPRRKTVEEIRQQSRERKAAEAAKAEAEKNGTHGEQPADENKKSVSAGRRRRSSSKRGGDRSRKDESQKGRGTQEADSKASTESSNNKASTPAETETSNGEVKTVKKKPIRRKRRVSKTITASDPHLHISSSKKSFSSHANESAAPKQVTDTTSEAEKPVKTQKKVATRKKAVTKKVSKKKTTQTRTKKSTKKKAAATASAGSGYSNRLLKKNSAE